MNKRKHQCDEACSIHGTRGWGWDGTTEGTLDDGWSLIKSALWRGDWKEAHELFDSLVQSLRS